MFAKNPYFVVLAGATAAATRPDGSEQRMLRSFNQLFATKGRQQDIVCKVTEESCVNDNCIVVSCGELDDGMNIPDDGEVCACHEGLVKCIRVAHMEE